MAFQPLKMWICCAFYAYYAYLAVLHCSMKNVHFGKKWQYVGIAFIYATVLFLGHSETYLYPFVSKTKCCDFYFFYLQLMFLKTPPWMWSQILVSSLHCWFKPFHWIQDPSWPCSSSGLLACLWALSWVWCPPVGGWEREGNWWKGSSLILQVMFNLWIMFRHECFVHKSHISF